MVQPPGSLASIFVFASLNSSFRCLQFKNPASEIEAAEKAGDTEKVQRLGSMHLQLQDLIIQHGISNSHRPQIWRELMQLDCMIEQEKCAPFSVLCTDEVCKDQNGHDIPPLDEATVHQIEVDVRRTCPGS